MRPTHSNLRWKKGIDSAYPCGQRTRQSRIEMNNLARGMDTNIRAPRADNFNRFAGNSLQRRLQSILYRPTFRLTLPAAERASVIFHSKRYPHRLPEVKSRNEEQCTRKNQRPVNPAQWRILDFHPLFSNRKRIFQ